MLPERKFFLDQIYQFFFDNFDRMTITFTCFKNTETCCSMSVFQRVIFDSKSAHDISDVGAALAGAAAVALALEISKLIFKRLEEYGQ